MIVVRITGGLGNQLFQYALGRTLALRHDAPLLLDLSHYQEQGSDHTRRCCELDAFATRWREATPEEVRLFRTTRPQRLLEHIGIRGRYRTFHQHGFGFSPDVFGLRSPMYLQGTWQSERYFAEAANTLRAEIALARAFSAEAAELAGRMRSMASVSVHVRRGDYASDPKTRSYHGLLEQTWYEAAMGSMLEHVPDAHFFVFSDEPGWAREQFRSTAPITVLEPHSSPEDMALMARCRHHIIANSSFSWWGAWLNPDTGKRVIAPRAWFSDPAIDTHDLLPPDWIRL